MGYPPVALAIRTKLLREYGRTIERPICIPALRVSVDQFRSSDPETQTPVGERD